VSSPRVAVTFPGDPRSPASWSGVPANLIAGLEACGATVEAIDVRPARSLALAAQIGLIPRYLRKALPYPGRVLALADMGPELGTLRSRRANARLGAIEQVNGIVQLGSDYPVRSYAPLAVMEDRTLRQALEMGYPRWLAMPDRAMRTLIERQRAAYAAATAVCMVTDWAAGSARDDYGVPEGKLHAVGFGHTNAPDVVSRDWSVPRFLFVGREWERKRGEAVVAAFREIRERAPNATLDVVSTAPPRNVAGVTWHGEIAGHEVAALLTKATCLVVPSKMEPAGIVYLEAGAAGVPSIGTTVGGAADLIGDAGRTVDPADPGALFEAMLELCDPGTAEALGQRALERSKHFTWREVAARVLRALSLPGA
jgi:glycogen synthase